MSEERRGREEEWIVSDPDASGVSEAPAGDGKERFNFVRELFDWGQALTYAIVIIILGFTFLGRMLSVSGSSMTDTLHDGEYMLISNLFFTPSPGDIVIFAKNDFLVNQDGAWSVEPLVKRVVAVAGDTVTVDYAAQAVLVNGTALEEPYIREPVRVPLGQEVSYPYVVPEGHVFVMGDNRNFSTDSRYFGSVDTRMLLGRLVLRLTPFGKFGPVH